MIDNNKDSSDWPGQFFVRALFGSFGRSIRGFIYGPIAVEANDSLLVKISDAVNARVGDAELLDKSPRNSRDTRVNASESGLRFSLDVRTTNCGSEPSEYHLPSTSQDPNTSAEQPLHLLSPQSVET